MDIKNLSDAPAFITKDGSEIRELLAYRNSGIRNQSLAEARLPAGTSTLKIANSGQISSHRLQLTHASSRTASGGW